MAKALTPEQATALKQELLETRETEALEALSELGFRVTFHEMGRYDTEGDDLLGIPAGFKRGECFAVIYSRAGKRKQVTGGSAVEALGQAQAWATWNGGLKDDAPNKFVPSIDNMPTAAPIAQRLGSEQVAKQRHDGSERKILSFASGVAELVGAHGEQMHEANHAPQFPREADSKETTR